MSCECLEEIQVKDMAILVEMLLKMSKMSLENRQTKEGKNSNEKRLSISTGPAAEPSGRFPPPLRAGGGDGDPP